MDHVVALIDWLRMFVMQHAADRGIPTSALPVALILLVVGVALSVLGAKFARFALTSAFVLAGGALGDRFSEIFLYPKWLCIPLGALLIGMVGFQTFRLWVGAGVAVLLSAIVVSGFGANRVVPHLAEYAQTSPLKVDDSLVPSETEYSIPSPEQQAQYVQPDPRTWFSNFWVFLTERDPQMARNTQALGIVAALAGFCLGLMAVRPSLVISTSFFGTTLVAMGVATLMARSVDSSYTAIQNNPRIIGLGLVAFLASSLIIQTLLMRKATLGEPAPAKG